jgi:hypothetical protein
MPGLLAEIRLTIAEAVQVLRGLVLASRKQLRASPRAKLYEAGIRYRRERNRERWKTSDELYADGFGDCEDLAITRVAELAEDGIGARVVIVPTRPGRYHAIVEYEDGTQEDPSRILMDAERAEVGAPGVTMPAQNRTGIDVEVEKIGPNRFRVSLITPMGREVVKIPGSGKTKAQAFQRAALLAQQIAENPVVATILPPGSAKALSIAAELASRYKGGGLKAAHGFAKKLTGGGAKRLIKALF